MKILFILLFSTSVIANSQMEVYNQILKNKPSMDKKTAKLISHHIQMVYIKYKIPRRIYTAILMQESKYDLKAFNKKSKDYGISQINEKTIKAFGFDKSRLTTDLKYSIEAGAIVLADFQKRYEKKEATWFTRYNSSNPKKRKEYFRNIHRYLTPDLKEEFKVAYEN
jgi:hypothetical protein